MKFEKRFQAEIVPEWRIKYINYKGLKKRLRYIRREKFARDKEFMQNNHESNRISVFSHNIDSIHPEGTGIQSPNYDKRTSIQSQQRTFTINSVTDSVQDFFHKVSSALVTIQRQQSLSHHSHRHSIPPPPPQITSLDTLMDQVNTEERLFFTALDGELEKINHFYKIKEIEATNRMTMLIQQYEMLKEKKDEKKQSFETWKNTSNLVKQSIDYLTSPNTSSIYLEKSSTGIGLMDERQIYYKTAKKNIKKAVFEFYRGAELLRKYKTLNYNGFSKILKKYDMISERNGSEIYMQKVKNSYFVKSENIKKLLKDAEDFYVTHFEGGSRSKAIRRLRTPNKENKTYYPSMLRVGLYLGLALPPLMRLIYALAREIDKNKEILNLIGLYSGIFLPVIFLLLVGINMYIWTKLHINYKFIFEFNPRDNLDFRQYLELPAIIFLAMCYIMYFNFQVKISYLDYFTYPKLLIIFIFTVLFNPFRILYYNARRWFIFSMIRLIGSGILRVEFRDFFIADMLTSLSYSLTMLRFFGCGGGCIGVSNWTPCLGSIPALFRFLQCYKRYRDTRQINHLINLVKYGLNIIAIWMTFEYHVVFYDSEKATIFLVLWLFIQSIASIYTFSWDVKMDWSLFELNSGNYLLRDELGFESRWLYYCAIVLNFILRMSWLLLLLLTDKSTTNSLTIGFAIAFGEILRRWQWNLLRVENEHVNNCGQFRAVKEMPLPFQTELIGELHNFDNADVNIDYDRTPSLASWSSWSKKLFPKRKLNPADNWKDFEPTKSTSEYMYGENIFEESDDDSYDEDDDDNVGSRIISMTRMEGGHGLSNAYASRSFLPIIENSS